MKGVQLTLKQHEFELYASFSSKYVVAHPNQGFTPKDSTNLADGNSSFDSQLGIRGCGRLLNFTQVFTVREWVPLTQPCLRANSGPGR